MHIKTQSGDITQIKTDAIIISLFEGIKNTSGVTGAVDRKLNGFITKLIKSGEISGALNEINLIYSMGKIPADKIIIIGLGKQNEFNTDRIRQITAVVLKKASSLKIQNIATILHGAGVGVIQPIESAQMISEGAILGLYQFTKYQTPNINNRQIRELIILEQDKKNIHSIKIGIRLGSIIAESVNLARDLVNEPPNILTPTELANRAKLIAHAAQLKYTLFGLKEIRKYKMAGLLGVSQGSKEEPRFIILEYKGAKKRNQTPIGLIGKGVTFDSGGISIKPSGDMDHMKGDMAGAAAVIAAMAAIGKLKPNINVTALIPTTENLPSGTALKPADILTNMNGKTIEILNTDAEGRLILADAISYAHRLKLSPLLDVATLTGSCAIAIGPFCTGIFSNRQELVDEIMSAAEQAGERMWQMPMYPEFDELIKSKIADVKNIGTGREGGSITAAKFLEFFVENIPWAHLDIAPTYYITNPKTYYPFGGTGVAVRTFIQFLINKAK